VFFVWFVANPDGRAATDDAIAALKKLAADEAEDEELRKAAWRAVRRAQRAQDAAKQPKTRHSRWEVQP
jgi:hypothetical protein